MAIYKRIYLITVIGLILLMVSNLSAFADVQIIKTSTSNEDEKILRAQIDDYVKAFAAGDSKALANMWAPEGTFTDIDGTILHGRADIEAYFKTVFDQFGGQPLKITIESIKFPSDNVAIEEGRTRLLQGPLVDIINH